MNKILIVTLIFATSSLASDRPQCSKFMEQYQTTVGVVCGGVQMDDSTGECVIKEWPCQETQPNQSQVNALVAAYDTNKATKQAAANALYATISTRLGITITSKAELQSKLVDVWDALDTKEQAVWTAIEASGMNATRAGQLKQLAQARNKIMRLLAEDGIQ